MSVKAVVQQDFEGGWSTDLKIGIKNSQAFTQGMDFRKSPSQLSVLPQNTREDAGIVKDLILNEVMIPSGIIYAYGDQGYIYRRTTGGVWSEIGRLSSGCSGIDYRKDSDSIYLTSNKTASLLSPVSGTPILYPDKYNISFTTYNNSPNAGFNVSANQVGSNLTTSIGTTIIESQINQRFFQTDIEPMNKIQVFITAKGSGDWTVTVHDGLNNVLATSTVTNANLNNGSFNDFIFTTAPNGQVRLYPAPNARTYHIHVTSTVANGTVSSLVMNDLSSCDFQLWADRFVLTNNGLHPIQRFLQYETFGNGNYLSVWEPISDPPTNAEWRRLALVFPEEYEVCGLTVQNEFLVIAAERNTSVTTSVPQAGILFFWDGTSTTYNYFVEIPEGSPQAIHTYKNVTYYYAGGAWYGITSPTTQPVKIRTMPGTDTEYSGAASSPISVLPYAATVRRGVQLMAFPSKTTSTSINFGVYSWGAVDKNYPDSFGYNYLISTGTQNYSTQNNLQIGMVQSFGDLLHISWRDDLNGGYGIDRIDNSSGPSLYARWQGMIFDNGYVAKEKQALFVECYYTLPAGSTIQLAYSIDRGSFVKDTNIYSSTTLWQGQTGYAKFDVPTDAQGRFHEFQPQLEITSLSAETQPPVVYMVSTVFDDLSAEVLQ